MASLSNPTTSPGAAAPINAACLTCPAVQRKSIHLAIGWVFDSGTPEGDYELILNGQTFTGTLSSGTIRIDQQLNSLTGSGTLKISLTDGPIFTSDIRLGLEPLQTVGGLIQRLTNLGFYAGSSDYNTRAQWAMRAFKRAKINQFQRNQTVDENNAITTEVITAIQQAYGAHPDDAISIPHLGMTDASNTTSPCAMFGSHTFTRGSFEAQGVQDDRDASGAGNNGIWLGTSAAGARENIAGNMTLYVRAFDPNAGEAAIPNRINLPQPIRMAQFVLFELGYWVVKGSGGWVTVGGTTLTRNQFTPDGHFGRHTQWALREFQCYAKLNHAAKEELYSTEARYLPRLLGESPVSLVGHERLPNEARISGALNQDTRNALQAWAEKALRCPVIVFGSNDTDSTVANGSDLTRMRIENIWKHDDYNTNDLRMFAIDYSNYYNIPATYTGSVTVGQYTLPKPIVMGQYSPNIQGGPVTYPRFDHSWNSADVEVRPDTMLGRGGLNGAGLSAAELSTFKIVRTSAHFECLGMFDALNAYDDVTISLGPCHWTLARCHGRSRLDGREQREMPAFLAYFRQTYPVAYEATFGKFGLYPENNWPLTISGNRTYDDNITIQTETGQTLLCGVLATQAERMQENTYCKTWHSYYRFQMACRTSSDMHSTMWDFSRIRVRDILGYEFIIRNTETGERTTYRVSDYVTSEKCVAMILRWHIKRPSNVINALRNIIPPIAAIHPNATQARENAIRADIVAQGDRVTSNAMTQINNFTNIPQQGINNYYQLNLDQPELSEDVDSFDLLSP
ncbi:MAG: hypothetical protein KTR20_09775 [Cellvibrionaceae bacterium]|nr:hypothetical protein [Cellvibrionaceae bacterium]